jgi:hypothetical protein
MGVESRIRQDGQKEFINVSKEADKIPSPAERFAKTLPHDKSRESDDYKKLKGVIDSLKGEKAIEGFKGALGQIEAVEKAVTALEGMRYIDGPIMSELRDRMTNAIATAASLEGRREKAEEQEKAGMKDVYHDDPDGFYRDMHGEIEKINSTLTLKEMANRQKYWEDVIQNQDLQAEKLDSEIAKREKHLARVHKFWLENTDPESPQAQVADSISNAEQKLKEANKESDFHVAHIEAAPNALREIEQITEWLQEEAKKKTEAEKSKEI